MDEMAGLIPAIAGMAVAVAGYGAAWLTARHAKRHRSGQEQSKPVGNPAKPAVFNFDIAGHVTATMDGPYKPRKSTKKAVDPAVVLRRQLRLRNPAQRYSRSQGRKPLS